MTTSSATDYIFSSGLLPKGASYKSQLEVCRVRLGRFSKGKLLYHLYTFLKNICWDYQQSFSG